MFRTYINNKADRDLPDQETFRAALQGLVDYLDGWAHELVPTGRQTWVSFAEQDDGQISESGEFKIRKLPTFGRMTADDVERVYA